MSRFRAVRPVWRRRPKFPFLKQVRVRCDGNRARTSVAMRLSPSPEPGRLVPMIDEFAKGYLHERLRFTRQALLWKLDGLSEYDIRRPLTVTGTNLLGLVK